MAAHTGRALIISNLGIAWLIDMESFPAFLKLKSRPVVILGAGEEAVRKARLYADAGAALTIIAEDALESDFTDARFRNSAGSITVKARAPHKGDVTGAVIVVIADAPPDIATLYRGWAHEAGALVNVVDQPALCDFTTPSIIDRGDVVVAISTGGAAPVLGQKLRGQIEALAPPRLGVLAAFAKSFRDAVKAKVPFEKRRAFWVKVLEGPIAAQLLAGDEAGAREAMIETINRSAHTLEEKAVSSGEGTQDAAAPCGAPSQYGVVHIVGAGPGDPELLTMKAHRLLQQADVILYDKLVSDGILSLARRDAEQIFVGKTKACHAVAQRDIEAMMIKHAKAGKNVVRLKGGDPFVFGRGGEELEAVKAAGLAVYVTPGITAATGCAAAAGMALTHREHAQAVTFVTGHAKADQDPDLNWAALAALKHTLVVYMGVTKVETIASSLIAHGRGAQTPVAILENGSRPDQRIVKGDLAGLPDLVREHKVEGPALLVIGSVAQLADEALVAAADPARLTA